MCEALNVFSILNPKSRGQCAQTLSQGMSCAV